MAVYPSCRQRETTEVPQYSTLRTIYIVQIASKICTYIVLRTYRCNNNHAIQNHSIQNHFYSYLINRHLQQTHNTPHYDTPVYHPTGMYIHTSSSSFTFTRSITILNTMHHLYCTNNKWNMGVHTYTHVKRWDNNHAIENYSYSYWMNRHLQQTHNPPHSDTLVYHPTGTYIHTSSSSFTLHFPPSRRDWTSCSLPFAAATSRSLTTEALDAACHDRNSIQIYVYNVG